MRARALAVHACPLARGRPRRLLLSATRRQRRKVDKCRVADKKQTDKHTLLFYRYRYIYIYTRKFMQKTHKVLVPIGSTNKKCDSLHAVNRLGER